MKKRTSRIAGVALALVLCMSLMPVIALAVNLTSPEDAVNQRFHGTINQTNDPTVTPPERFPFGYERLPRPEEPPKEPEKQPEKEPEKQPEKQPEKEPEKRYEDIDRTLTDRYIKIMESGKSFEELWSNRESPLWTLGDIQQYLARRGMRIPTAGVGSAAHR